MPRAGLNSLPRPARSALNQEVRQGSCEWLCHSWDAGSESSLVTLFAFAVCEAYKQQNLRAVTERNTIRQDGVSQRVDKPTPLSFRGAKRRRNPYLFRQKPAKSAEFVRFRNGLPRQYVPQGRLLRGADWLAMTGFFDSLRNTIRQDGVFFLERAILLRKIGRPRAGD